MAKTRRPTASGARGAVHRLAGSPFLTRIGLHPDRVVEGQYPFTLPFIRAGLEITLDTPVTFVVGENGSGKSTLLEALAWALGFGAQGGGRNQSYVEGADGHPLGRALALSWRQRVTDGFFLRAETFFNFATYLEEVGSDFHAYGGKPLHEQSHGEAFLSLFQHRFEDGIYLLDEPEAALSPARQLAFLRVIHDLTVTRRAQLIVATHSPMLLTFPGARVLQIEAGELSSVRYQDTEHYQLTRGFLEAPERFYRLLFSEDEDEDYDAAEE